MVNTIVGKQIFFLFCSFPFGKLFIMGFFLMPGFHFLFSPHGKEFHMLTDKLIQSTCDIWDSYYTHPFVSGIGDGSLSIERFQFYMIQDYLYLYEYAKVFALGAAKSSDHRLMRFFSSYLHATLNGEMKIHEAYMKRLSITEDMIENTPMSLTNTSYTTYMLKIAYEGDCLDILTAIYACALSYEKIGRQLALIPGALTHPFYGEWVAGYASDDYAAGNKALTSDIDRLGAAISPEKEKRLIEIFRNCSIYEARFWDMAYHMEA